MVTLGKLLDYSQARPPLAIVKAHGYSCVYRYVCSDGSEAGLRGKRLTPAERDQILAARLDIGLHGEDEAGAARNGYPRGKAQGQQWADYAHSVLAAPKGMTIVPAIDYDTAGTYPPVVADYLHGVTDGMQGEYATGVYGSIYVVDAALAAKHAVHGVQTNAWSHGKVSTWAHVYQHGGSEFPGTDYNDIFRRPHGTWLQTLNGDDVPLTPTEIDAIATAAAGKVNAHTDTMLQKYLWPALTQGNNSAFTGGINMPDLAARIAALQSAVSQLGAGGGTIDYGKVQAAAEAALDKLRVVTP